MATKNKAPAAVKATPIVKLIEGTKQIETAIASIATRGKKLDSDIQLCGLSVLNHAEKHGDVTLINRLYSCMPQGSRRRALAEWLMAYGKVTANVDRTTQKEQPFVYAKGNRTDLEGAAQEPWYTFAPEPSVADMFDLTRALHMLLGRAKKAGKVDDMDLYAKLQQLDDSAQSRASLSNPAQASAVH